MAAVTPVDVEPNAPAAVPQEFLTTAALAAKARRKYPQWYPTLICDSEGVPLATLANACAALRAVDESEYHVKTTWHGREIPWGGNELDPWRLAEWLQRRCIIVTPSTAGKAREIVRAEKSRAAK
jgi:hypothetical protein